MEKIMECRYSAKTMCLILPYASIYNVWHFIKLKKKPVTMTIAQKSFQFQVSQLYVIKQELRLNRLTKTSQDNLSVVLFSIGFFYMFIPQQVKMSLKGLSSEISAAKSELN
jgi:hypothetical protein